MTMTASMFIPLLASVYIFLYFLTPTTCSPLPSPIPRPGLGSLFGSGGISAFTQNLRTTSGRNSDFSCTRNGKPCEELKEQEEQEQEQVEVQEVEEDDVDVEVLEIEDGEERPFSKVRSGSTVQQQEPQSIKKPKNLKGLKAQREREREINNPNRRKLSRGSLKFRNADNENRGGTTLIVQEEDLDITKEESIDFDQGDNEPIQVVDADKDVKFLASCTKNGVPCSMFVPGSQREITVERTASCERNGLPCDEAEDLERDPETGKIIEVDREGSRLGESMNIEKKNKSFRSCTKNGVPCKEWEEKKIQGDQNKQQQQQVEDKEEEEEKVEEEVEEEQIVMDNKRKNRSSPKSRLLGW